MNDVLIGHGIIDYAVVLSLCLYALYAGFTKSYRILYILPACVSFFFFLEIGPRLTPDKLAPFLFILAVLMKRGFAYFKTPNANNTNKYWIISIVVLIGLSFMIGLAYLNYYSLYLNSPFLSNRLYVQIIGYVNYILIFIIAKNECSKPEGYYKLIKSFVVTTTILAIYGVYQYIAHEYGLPYRGIVYAANKTGIGSFSDFEDTVFRVNSFANEPKRLTYFLVIGILILFKYRNWFLNRIRFIPYIAIVILHFTILWLTYSTSIYISISLFIVSLLIYSIFLNYNVVLLRSLLIFLVLGVFAFFYQEAYLKNLYDSRVEQQLDREEVRAEVKGQEFILNNPTMFIVGLGPGIYNFALAKEYPGRAGISVTGKFLIPFNSGFMTYLYDFGIVGTIFLMLPLFRILRSKYYSKNEASIYVVFLYFAMITLNPSSTLFLFIGAFDGYEIIRE